MDYKIIETKRFKYIEEGEGEVLLLLHGLFGALSNFTHVIEKFSGRFKVVIPILPLYEMSLFDTTLTGLVKFVNKFVKYKKFDQVHLLGNSLGGHIALMYTLKYPNKVKTLTLTGSSGLFEDSLGGSFPKRGNYEYIKERTEYTFYDPKVATKELVDEVFGIVNDRNKAIRVISIAKSAMRNNLSKEIPAIKCPVFLIWGYNDTITPAYVANEFNRLIENSKLEFIDQCGHAPMMEKPHEFNTVLEKLFDEYQQKQNK